MINLTRGDTLTLKFQRKNSDGEIITPKPSEVIFSVKSNYNSTKTLIQKKLSDGTIEYNEETFYYTFKLEHDDTKELAYDEYKYDIEVQFDNEVKTIALGSLNLTHEVTF